MPQSDLAWISALADLTGGGASTCWAGGGLSAMARGGKIERVREVWDAAPGGLLQRDGSRTVVL